MTIDFLDMDVLIEAPGGDPCVRVIKSPVGKPAASPSSRRSKSSSSNFLTRVGRPRTTRRVFPDAQRDPKDLAEAKDVGGQLFGALFRGRPDGLPGRQPGRGPLPQEGASHPVRVTDCPEFADYPWEFL